MMIFFGGMTTFFWWLGWHLLRVCELPCASCSDYRVCDYVLICLSTQVLSPVDSPDAVDGAKKQRKRNKRSGYACICGHVRVG